LWTHLWYMDHQWMATPSNRLARPSRFHQGHPPSRVPGPDSSLLREPVCHTQTTVTDPGETMPTAPGPPHDFQSIGLLVTLVAALCVIYWRIAIRLVAIAVIALTIYGAVLLVEGLQHAGR
jgi:hypothetical protein